MSEFQGSVREALRPIDILQIPQVPEGIGAVEGQVENIRRLSFVDRLEIEFSLIDLKLECGLIEIDEFALLMGNKVQKAVDQSFKSKNVDFGALGCLIWRKMRQLSNLQR